MWAFDSTDNRLPQREISLPIPQKDGRPNVRLHGTSRNSDLFERVRGKKALRPHLFLPDFFFSILVTFQLSVNTDGTTSSGEPLDMTRCLRLSK